MISQNIQNLESGSKGLQYLSSKINNLSFLKQFGGKMDYKKKKKVLQIT